MTTTDQTASDPQESRTVLRMTPPALRLRRRADDPPVRRRPEPPGTAAGDRLLLAAAGRGDSSAWDQIVQTHLPSVWAWSLQVAGPEDALQTCELVWLRLAQNPPCDPLVPLRDWLRLAVLAVAVGIPRVPRLPGPRRPANP